MRDNAKQCPKCLWWISLYNKEPHICQFDKPDAKNIWLIDELNEYRRQKDADAHDARSAN